MPNVLQQLILDVRHYSAELQNEGSDDPMMRSFLEHTSSRLAVCADRAEKFVPPESDRWWIQTFMGGSVDFLGVLRGEPQKIELDSICHHLSLCNRFAGATCRAYSVAEHQIGVAHMTDQWCVGSGLEADEVREVRLCALTHDAPEYATGDVLRPLKHLLRAYTDVFDRIDAELQRQIDAHLDIRRTPMREAIVKLCDEAILQVEHEALMAKPPRTWPTQPAYLEYKAREYSTLPVSRMYVDPSRMALVLGASITNDLAGTGTFGRM